MLIVREEPAQGLVEYALLLMFVFLVVLLILTVFSGQVGNMYSKVSSGVGSLPP